MSTKTYTDGRVGPTLKAYRLDAGLSQLDLQDRSGIPKPRISRYENGHVLPTIDTLAALCEAMNTRASELLIDAGL